MEEQRVKESVYKGWRAFTFESGRMRVTVIPELGGKIVSLVWKPTGKEWLVDSGNRSLGKVDYASSFEDADVSGWDECFPTVIACEYPHDGAYKGRLMPDHGELWSIAWHAEVLDGRLVCTAQGRELPYDFSRTMHLRDDNTLRMEYSVTNRGNEPLSVFWCVHPLFAVTEQTRILLPEENKKVLCVDGGKALESGRLYDWPAGDGRFHQRLDRIGPVSALDSRKFYVEGPLSQGWTGLYESDSGEYIKLEWSPEELPYLGIWINEGNVTEKAICALEPCNGYYDSLAEAARQDKLIRIAPRAVTSWDLVVRLGCGSIHLD
jgi:galactose mutarotase-like enzyme